MAEPTRRREVVIALALMLAQATALCLSVSPAEAQQIGDDERRARQLSYEGEQAYAEGRFDEAVVLIRRAYELFEEPLLLHNLGRALESTGDEEGAVDAYERYLEAMPDADNRAHVEGRLRSLRAEIAEDAVRQQTTAEDGALSEGPERDDPSSGGVSAGPFIIGGIGVATLVAGTVTGVLALDKQTEARDEPVQERAQELLDEGATLATVTNIFLVAGGVLVAAGVTWLVIELAGDDEDVPVEVGLGLGSVTLAGRFD